MAKHSKLSASGTKRWALCAGSQALIESRPDLIKPSGDAANLGTSAHTLAETCLNNNLAPKDFIDRIIVIEKDDAFILNEYEKAPKDKPYFIVDQDMIEAVEVYVNYIQSISKNSEIAIEAWTNPLPNRDDTGGTADCIIDNWPDCLEVVDYKHGAGVFVPVKNNYQLLSYLLGRASEDEDFSYDSYKYTIVQPRHMQSYNNGIMSEIISKNDLKEFAYNLNESAIRVDEAREKVSDGAGLKELFEAGYISVGDDGDHCGFCEFKHECPAIFSKAQELTKIDFYDEPEDLPPIDEDNLSKILHWAPLLDKWLKAVNLEAQSKLMRGDKVEGYKLVRKRSVRKYADTFIYITEDGDKIYIDNNEDSLTNIVSDLYEVPIENMFTDPKLITGPQLEKLIPKDKRPEFNNVFLVKPEADLTLAHESDKRPEVIMNIEDDFKDDRS